VLDSEKSSRENEKWKQKRKKENRKEARKGRMEKLSPRDQGEE